MTSPTIEDVQRALALLRGPQRRVLDLLADGQQPTAGTTGLAPEEVARAVAELTGGGLIVPTERVDAAELTLTARGAKVAQLARQLDAGRPASA